MAIDNKIITAVREMIHSLNYADAAKTLFIIMYGDSRVPEFDCGVDDDGGNAHLNLYMKGKGCCRIKRVISCKIILSAKDPVDVVYKEFEEMRELLMSYEEKEVQSDANKSV